MEKLSHFFERFNQSFIVDARWEYILEGLKVTLIVTFLAIIIGFVLGLVLFCSVQPWSKTEITWRPKLWVPA